MRLLNLFFSGVIIWCLIKCDTVNNVDQPRYFIKYYGEEGHQQGVDLIANSDGTIFLFGNTSITRESKDQNLVLVKTDENGIVLWQKFYGGSTFDEARDIELSSDGRIILLANTVSSTGNKDIMIIITDQQGMKLDSTVYGYPDTDEEASTITQINDGFIVTGVTTNTNQKANPVANDKSDAFNFRFYDNLTVYPDIWNQTLGPGTFDAGVKVIQTGSGFYFFGYSNKSRPGQTGTDFNYWIFPMNNFGDGSFNMGQEIFAGGQQDERLSAVTISPVESGEGFLLTGTVTDATGISSIFIAKLRKTLNFSSTDPSQVFQFDAKAVGTSLGNLQLLNAKSSASVQSGFLLLANDNNSGDLNFYLTKITNSGANAWEAPSGFEFGGAREDKIGAVAETPDGSILMIGTFSIGDDGQEKIVLIKVSKNGKFQG